MDLTDAYDMKRRRTNTFGLGVIAGILLMVVIMTILDSGGPTREEMQRRFDAYHQCMQIPNCRMDTGDFIEYYDLKYKLLQLEN